MIKSILAAAALGLSGLLLAPAAAQQAQAPSDALAEARRDLADAARRIAELSAQAGADAATMAIVRMEGAGQRPRIGVVLGSNADGDVVVQAVTPEGPAEEAGLLSGDVIDAVDGEGAAGNAAERLTAIHRHLRGAEEGRAVVFDIRRDGQPRRIEVSPRVMQGRAWLPENLEGMLGERLRELEGLRERGLMGGTGRFEIGPILPFGACDADDADCIGPRVLEALRWRSLNLAAVDASLGRYFGVDRGVLVVSGNERLSGLEAGDVILAVDGRDVDTPRDVMRGLSRHAPGDTIELRIQRDQGERTISLTAPAGDEPGAMMLRRLRTTSSG